MDLTEAEDIKKRQQEYTEELYKKDIHDPDNHDGDYLYLGYCKFVNNAAMNMGVHSSFLSSVFIFFG